jgi:uncharacterized protein (TIGR00730 family)
MASVCVFCGSRNGFDPQHAALTATLATRLAVSGHTIVYGGGAVGLMGVLADAALAADGEVIGVIPGFLKDRELAHPRLSRLEVVNSMHSRKQRMLELSDVVVALPGGIGTLDELVEAVTWAQLGLHAKPIWLLNQDSYWQPLLDLCQHFEATGFAHGRLLAQLRVCSTVDEFMDALELLSV